MTSVNTKWAQQFCDMLHESLTGMGLTFQILLVDEDCDIPAWQKTVEAVTIVQVEYWVTRAGVSVRFHYEDDVPDVNIHQDDLDGALSRVLERTKMLVQRHTNHA